MKKILSSKALAWCLFILIMALLIATFSQRANWWNFLDIFFLFMMAFTHAIALMIARFNKFAATRLDIIALIMAILGIIFCILNLCNVW